MKRGYRILGRNDYREPAALTEAQRQRIASVQVSLALGKKTWFAVRRNGKLLGYVATRIVGQEFKTPDMEVWVPAADDWNRTDPPHGHAILRLLDVVKPLDASPVPSAGTES